MDILKNWIIKNKGVISNNIHNNKVIDFKNKYYLKIPDKIILNVNKYWDIPNIYKWNSHYELDEDDNIFLNDKINKMIILLIYEKTLGKKSFYYPYISTLPLLIDFKDYAICNITDENKEIWKELSFFFYRNIENFEIFIDNFLQKIKYFNNIYPIIDLNNFFYDKTLKNNNNSILKSLIIWGFLIYHKFNIDNMLIPYINCFENNTNGLLYDTNSFYKNNDNIIITSDKIIKNKIYINYNYENNYKLDNKDLLYLHNYTNLENKYMNISLDLKTNLDNNILSDVIKKYLQKFENNQRIYQLINNLSSNDLIYKLRILSLNDYDYKNINENEFFYKKIISFNNELEVFYILLQLLVTLKKKYFLNYSLILSNFYINSDNFILSTLSKIHLIENDIIDNTIINIQNNYNLLLNNIYSLNNPKYLSNNNFNNIYFNNENKYIPYLPILYQKPDIDILTKNKKNIYMNNILSLANLLNINTNIYDNINNNHNHYIISDNIFFDLSLLIDKRVIFINFGIIPHNFNKKLYSYYKNSIFCLNSKWSMNLWKNAYPNMNLRYLPIFIDYDKYNQTIKLENRNKVFIFYKKRDLNELKYICKILNNKNIEYIIINSNNIKNDIDFFYNLLKNTKYAIWLSSHETVNIKLLQTLSCNIPIFVWDVRKLSQEINCPYIYYNIDHIVSSIPYWDSNCGEIIYKKEEFTKNFEIFINNLSNYKPREFILQNFNYHIQSLKFINLFTNN